MSTHGRKECTRVFIILGGEVLIQGLVIKIFLRFHKTVHQAGERNQYNFEITIATHRGEIFIVVTYNLLFSDESHVLS